MNYRSDIDGLRSIAVLPVILSHAGVSAFSGGFVGVDIFFVISGYLITTILISEMATGDYSLRHFYERRARRILPALLVVILASLPFAYYLMLPDFFQNFGQSVAATLLFANNLLLAKTAGYWDLQSAYKPMLHTWSLGVEEQYYIVFPLLLAAVWRFGLHAQILMIALLGAVSFGFSEFGWRNNPTVTFYIPTTRAWELMIGSAAAYWPQANRKMDNLVSTVGLIAIFGSIFLYDETTPSPSFYMLLPSVGAALIILCSRKGTISHFVLSQPICVGIGLISYSAYLWHQPIFAIARVATTETPPQAVMLALGLASLGLAYLTWRYVEVPFRSKKLVASHRSLAPVFGLSAMLIVAGFVIHVKQGFPLRTFPNLENGEDVYITYNENIRQFSDTKFVHGSGLKVLVLGDSFGRDVANVLFEAGALDASQLIYAPLSPDEIARGDHSDEIDLLLNDAAITVVAVHDGEPSEIILGLGIIKAATRGDFLVFGTKHFGSNLNPFGRVPVDERTAVRSRVPEGTTALDVAMSGALPPAEYVSLLKLMGGGRKLVRVFDEDGNPLSPDGLHLTKYGAKFISQRLVETRPDVLERFNAVQ